MNATAAKIYGRTTRLFEFDDTGAESALVEEVSPSVICWLDSLTSGMTIFCAIELQISQILKQKK